jgi:hypothetical protein
MNERAAHLRVFVGDGDPSTRPGAGDADVTPEDTLTDFFCRYAWASESSRYLLADHPSAIIDHQSHPNSSCIFLAKLRSYTQAWPWKPWMAR